MPTESGGSSAPIAGREPPCLTGQRIVTVGFEEAPGAALVRLFEAAGAFCRALPGAAAGAGGPECDVAVVCLETWPPPAESGALPELLLAALPSELLGQHAAWVRNFCADCVFWPCSGEELVFRTGWALQRHRAAGKRRAVGPFGVVVADDDPSITALVKAVLESEGLPCRAVPDGAAALAAAREGAGLLILDVRMPGMDGYQVLSALKSDGTTRSLPVILLTACDQESEVVRGFGLGAEDYIVKPFNPLEVLMRVKRIAERTR